MTKKISSPITVAILLALLSITSVNAQLKIPAASPSQTTKQAFALGEITVEYSRPATKGRTIFGDLVPYGKVWRTGANATTKITFSNDVKLEGKEVKAGTYGLFTIPNKTSWDVMLSKDLNLGANVADYKQANEVVRVQVKPTSLANKVETFTINLADIKPSSATLEIIWDNVRVPVAITADVDQTIVKNIEASMASDKPAYFEAASYYYDSNRDLKQALGWVNKAVEQNPKAFWVMLLKARIELKLKEKDAAIASAQKTVTLATEAKNGDYVKMAEDLIASAKK
jgi:tetratricopeptide (TPR) repeat protein